MGKRLNVGIIGCGNIGTIVAQRGVGMRMQVIAFDPYLSASRAANLQIQMVDLPDLFARSRKFIQKRH